MNVMPFKNIVGSAIVPALRYGGHGGPRPTFQPGALTVEPLDLC
jgi:hypothetical protein